ncbi:MAG: trimeric intracellular cation channel family protein [Ignavibacteria bacterium]|nr:trimeric intracellular cation channel family protein [Ignavibacteria bacterium]
MDALLKTIEILGIFAFAITGIIEARRKQMDIIGTYSVAMVTAFGGGTLRDVLINRYPLFWMENYNYPVMILALAVISVFVLRKSVSFSKPVLLSLGLLDALGLGLFSAVGTSYALSAGVFWFNAVLIGVITGVFGGVMRDVICNEVPVFFKQSQLYATCSFIGALVFVILLNYFPESSLVALLSSISAAFVLRVISIKYNIQLKF